MKDDALQKAHLIYEVESKRIEGLLAKDEVYSGMLERLEQAERRLAGTDHKAAEAMAEARNLLLEMTREASFKLGYVLAKDYPLDETFTL
ncbi:MAG: hypothetical protein K9K66_19090 [Desulfarculaceae bacterium]|nr:hypothetical protein [Desulfarculaceae bacterium]MCF8074111.1 hypothetical protein [Desulfarculaceae bacterium]MCF8103766.1 hypothetical protein [Desulfarculaceae bacterium]MCF8116845.1 hypothetical protein [Desulfarculaceae bacterium]